MLACFLARGVDDGAWSVKRTRRGVVNVGQALKDPTTALSRLRVQSDALYVWRVERAAQLIAAGVSEDLARLQALRECLTACAPRRGV